MKRFADWQQRLVDYLNECFQKRFMPSEHDCAHFGDNAVYAMTGQRLAPPWGKDYTTLKEGIKLLRQHGYRNLVDYLSNIEDLKEIPPSFAHRGDIGIIKGDITGGVIGIVQGEYVYVLNEEGLALVSRLNMIKAFRV